MGRPPPINPQPLPVSLGNRRRRAGKRENSAPPNAEVSSPAIQRRRNAYVQNKAIIHPSRTWFLSRGVQRTQFSAFAYHRSTWPIHDMAKLFVRRLVPPWGLSANFLHDLSWVLAHACTGPCLLSLEPTWLPLVSPPFFWGSLRSAYSFLGSVLPPCWLLADSVGVPRHLYHVAPSVSDRGYRWFRPAAENAQSGLRLCPRHDHLLHCCNRSTLVTPC